MVDLITFVRIISNLSFFFLDLFPDNTCYLSSKPSHTNTSSLYVFGYNGRPISEDCQTISLHSADATLDKYRLCITPESFRDPNCSVTVEFRFSDTVMVKLCFCLSQTTHTSDFCILFFFLRWDEGVPLHNYQEL